MLAAAIAYYLAFSLFPLMLVLVAGIGWAFRATAAGHDAQQRVMAAASSSRAAAAGPTLGFGCTLVYLLMCFVVSVVLLIICETNFDSFALRSVQFR